VSKVPATLEEVSVAEDLATVQAGTEGQGGKAETQDRILKAALELFAAQGYERTSTSLIAARAGVSRSAVFWHFGDKPTLFQEAFRLLLDPFALELKGELRCLPAEDRIPALFDSYEEFVGGNRETVETFVRWVLESPTLREKLRAPLLSLHDAFTRELGEAVEELLGTSEETVAISAALVALLDGNLVLTWLDPDARSNQRRRTGLRVLAKAVVEGGPARLDRIARAAGA
jgi:AcrR family transcriptional regulator